MTTVRWVTDKDVPLPTRGVIYAYWVFLHALQDAEARAEFESLMGSFSLSCGPLLNRFLREAESSSDSDGYLLERLSGPIDGEAGWVEEELENLVTPWCEKWAGFSMESRGMATTEMLLRFYGVPKRLVTDLEGYVGGLTDPNWALLLNPDRPRAEKALRAEARRRVRGPDGMFAAHSEATLARWARICWEIRVRKSQTVERMAEAEGVEPRTFYDQLSAWDAAIGYVRRPGRPPNPD